MTLLLGFVGLFILVGGAELLVRGSSRIAVGFGISPVVVGLTIVALGTSSPELAVSLQAAFNDQSDLTVGNVVGSNIFNVLVILGMSALVVPLVVSQRLVRIDVPLMVGVSMLTLVLCLNHTLGRLDGLILTLGLAGYIAFAIYESRRDSREIEVEYDEEFGDGHTGRNALLTNGGMFLAGLALLVLGSHWLVNAAEEVALELGLSEFVVGLTIVATGTSLPEVATSLVAAIKGERDIAVGNVVGSNLFNLLAVLGISSLVAPAALVVPDSAVRFDLLVMVAVAIACVPVFLTGVIARWQGGLFLGFYIAYVGYLILDSSGHEATGAFSDAMIAFVLPLSALALLGGLYRHRTRVRVEEGSKDRA